MHKTLSSSNLQLEIQIALDELPIDLHPGYPDELDFSPLMSRISKLQQQHLVLCLSSWISRNASWLEGHGFVMDRSWLPDGPHSVTMLYCSNDAPMLFEAVALPAERHAAVLTLIRQLSEAALVGQWPLIAELICDLNTIRWNPQRSQCVLTEALEDVMEDGETWLLTHQAYSEARHLQLMTSTAPTERARGRL
jgi:hypothetical protein